MNEQSDPSNCGGCGQTCSAATPIPLEQLQIVPAQVVTDSANVYWVDIGEDADLVNSPTVKTSASVVEAPLGGGPVQVLASDLLPPVTLAVSDAGLFFDANGTIYQVASDGGSLITLTSSLRPSNLFADSQSLYFEQVTVSSYEVARFDLDGGQYTQLSGDVPGPILAIDDQYAYVGAGTTLYGVNKAPLSDGGYSPPVSIARSMVNPITSLVVDATRAYWTTGADVEMAPLSGGGPTTVLAANQAGSAGITLAGNELYWVDSTPNDIMALSLADLGSGVSDAGLIVEGRRDLSGFIASTEQEVIWTEGLYETEPGAVMTAPVSEVVPACASGACGCPAPGVACASACVDESSDPFNCGGCGKVVVTGSYCDAGVPTCPAVGEEICGTACVDTLTDINHCGACNNACTAPTVGCSGGECVCPVGQSFCGNTCIDTQTDSSNCGNCEVSCSGVCAGGQCATITALATGLTEPASLQVDATGAYFVANGDQVDWALLDGSGMSELIAAPCGLIQGAGVGFSSIALDTAGIYGLCQNMTNETIVLVDRDGGSSTIVVGISGNYTYYGDNLVIGAGRLCWNDSYVDDGTPGTIAESAPLAGGSPTFLFGNEPESGLAVAGDQLVFDQFGAGQSNPVGEIFEVPIDGGRATSLAYATPYGVQFAADSSTLYWFDNDGVLSFMPLVVGDSPAQLLTGLVNPQAILLDGSTLYWSEGGYSDGGGGSVRSMDLDGGTERILARGVPGSIAVDSNSLYWIDGSQGPGASQVLKLTPK